MKRQEQRKYDLSNFRSIKPQVLNNLWQKSADFSEFCKLAESEMNKELDIVERAYKIAFQINNLHTLLREIINTNQVRTWEAIGMTTRDISDESRLKEDISSLKADLDICIEQMNEFQYKGFKARTRTMII